MASSAPVVQNLQNLVSQFTAAQAPEDAQIDSEVSQNDQSGTAQIAGVNQAKDNAFGDITNAANARGALFSGFTPSQEASYTGSTYLPALAKIQAAIATTRNTLLGSKANLASTANTNALNEQKTEQQELNTYKEQQQAQSATKALQLQSEQFTKQEDALKLAAAEQSANQPTVAAQNAAALQALNRTYQSALTSKGAQGKDGYVSPTTYNAALKSYESEGGTAQQFKAAFSGYANPNQKNVNPNDLYIGL